MNTKVYDIKKKKKIFCNNCGKYGHVFSLCKEPITSLGIINFKCEKFNDLFINKYGEFIKNSKDIIIPLNNKIYCPVTENNEYLHKFNIYSNTIKFLMIRRKNTLGYIEFIRGNYEISDTETLVNLFQQMIKEEIELIELNDFDTLWNKLWTTTSSYKIYENEYKNSKNKFYKLKDGDIQYNLYFYTKNIEPDFPTPEWGFPKGRRNNYETNFNCAIREFCEESNFKKDDYTVLKKLHSLNEIFLGTNGIRYKHIYYISINNHDKDLCIDEKNQEIGDIGWFTYSDALKLIRPYHIQRIKILTQLYMFILNNIINYEINNV